MSTVDSLAICMILLTLCWTIVLLQTIQESRARFLVGMVGLVSTFHGVRLLTGSGVEEYRAVAAYDGFVDLLVALLTFVALIILNTEAASHRITKVRLRLAQAMEPPAPAVSKTAVSRVFERSPRASAVEGAANRMPAEVALERLIQSTQVAVIALDEEGRVCMSNAAADHLFSVDEGKLLGKPLPPLPSAHQRKQRRAALRTIQAHS